MLLLLLLHVDHSQQSRPFICGFRPTTPRTWLLPERRRVCCALARHEGAEGHLPDVTSPFLPSESPWPRSITPGLILYAALTSGLLFSRLPLHAHFAPISNAGMARVLHRMLDPSLMVPLLIVVGAVMLEGDDIIAAWPDLGITHRNRLTHCLACLAKVFIVRLILHRRGQYRG
jgi:hypothetical protein